MVMLPVPPKSTKTVIDDRQFTQEHRPYLGMSQIGHGCSRFLWLTFRWAFDRSINARFRRILERGDIEEKRVIRDLVEIGCKCYRVDRLGYEVEITGEVGEVQEEIIGFAGHEKGHIDGRVLGVIEAPKTPHLLEIKTANENNFRKMEKDGIMLAHVVYWSQAQRYMKALGLKRTLFIVTNKNTEERYIERIKLDEDTAQTLEAKSKHIIMSELAPPLKYNRSWFLCRYCDARHICHDNEPVKVTCRTCKNVDIHDKGTWKCSLDDRILDYNDQMNACKYYEVNI